MATYGLCQPTNKDDEAAADENSEADYYADMSFKPF